ncbi:5695_t:CDS:1, partial [Acaulospora morrowiae]
MIRYYSFRTLNLGFFNSKSHIIPYRIVDFRLDKLLQTKTRVPGISRKDGFLYPIERMRGLVTNHRSQKKCWKCNSEINYLSLSCINKECGVIQKPLPNDVTYFELLRMHEDNFDP